MYYWKFFLRWFISVFAPHKVCKHTRVNPLLPFEKHCPDCGQRVVVKWYFIKCADCHTKRPGLELFDDLVPHDKHCKRCGYDGYEIEEKETIAVFEYSYATFKLVVDEAYLYETEHVESTTEVWLEPSHNMNYRTYSLKLLPVTASF